MVSLLSVDYSLEKALGLLDMTIRFGGGHDGHRLCADNEDLGFVSSFINSEITRYEKEPLIAGSFEDGLADLENLQHLLQPLKSLKYLVEGVLRLEGEKRGDLLLVLADEVIIIGAGVFNRAKIIDATYPGLRAKEAATFGGLKHPERALAARRKDPSGEKPPGGRLPS